MQESSESITGREGSLPLGLFFGQLAALIIFLGGNLASGFLDNPGMSLIKQIKYMFTAGPVYYTHGFWMMLPLHYFEVIVSLVAVVAAPVIGGFLVQKISRTDRARVVLAFSLVYLVIFMLMQFGSSFINLSGTSFTIGPSMDLYNGLSLQAMGIRLTGFLATVMIYGYFFLSTLALSYIGSMLAQR